MMKRRKNTQTIKYLGQGGEKKAERNIRTAAAAAANSKIENQFFIFCKVDSMGSYLL